MKNNISNIIIILIILQLFSCSPKNKTITLKDIAVDVPEDFISGFLDSAISIDNTVEFNESYGAERKTAIYTVTYIQYKIAYSGILNLENAVYKVINNLKNNKSIKEFEIVSEGYKEGMKNSYEVLSSFYYGPNKTYHKSFSMIHNNGILQIMCMYNANSKKDDKIINDIIKSVRILENK